MVACVIEGNSIEWGRTDDAARTGLPVSASAQYLSAFAAAVPAIADTTHPDQGASRRPFAGNTSFCARTPFKHTPSKSPTE